MKSPFTINRIFPLFIPILGVMLLMNACQKDNPAVTFDAVLKNGGDMVPAQNAEEIADKQDFTDIINGEVWNCTTTTYSALAPGGGDKGFPLFNPNASVIYPGSLLQGKSLKKATPDVIAVNRAGGVVSYDLVNGNTSSFFEVEEVSKASIGNAMNQIIANSPPDLPANFVFNYSQVQSERALALKLGIDYETAFTSISGNFGFSSGSSLNRIVVELNQSFFTMSFNIPTSLAGLFAPDVTPADLARYVQPGNPATYISDVTYGRIYYMLIESTSSYTEMEAAVNASFSGVVASANANIEASSLNSLRNLKIKVMAFGGEATTTLLTIGESNLNNLVQLLAASTTISTGVPISYVVRSVYNNQIVSVQLATEYDVTECTPAAPGGEPPYTAHWKGNVLSRMGPVGAAFSGYGTEFYLINKAGDQYMVSNVGSLEGPFPISNLGTGTPPFKIGSACRIDGNQVANSWVMVVDVTGSQYSYLRGDGSWSTQTTPISNLAVGNNPFAISGIGAMMFRHRDPNGPLQRWIFNKDGTRYSLYSNNPNSFGSVTNTAGSGWKLPFTPERVGAGIGFFLGVNRFFIVFNHTGTQYAVHGPLYGAGQESIGPFDL
jgi:thiol-activated cytolysin